MVYTYCKAHLLSHRKEKTMENYNPCIDSLVGINDAGFPLVSSTYACCYFKRQADSLCDIEECWYCAYADFRKSEVQLNISLCRHPYNRVPVLLSKRNENLYYLQKGENK